MSTEDKISSDELTDLIGRVRVSFGGFEDADALIAEAEQFAARLAEVEAERDTARRQIEMIRAEWHQADADREAARPVVEAAAAYEAAWDRYANPSKYPGLTEEVRRLDKANAHQALLNAVRVVAVDLYRSATSDHPSTTGEKP